MKFLGLLRRDFLAGAVPVTLQGMGGPGAPHHFEFIRRESLGLDAETADNTYWKLKDEDQRANDVILRTLVTS